MKLYKNWSEIAAVLGKTKGLVSRYSALAELPKAGAVDAFASPNDIQPKWAEQLREVIEADAAAVLQAADGLKGKRMSARAIFDLLINNQAEKLARVNYPVAVWTESTRRISIEIDKTVLSGADLVCASRVCVVDVEGEFTRVNSLPVLYAGIVGQREVRRERCSPTLMGFAST